MSRPASTRPTPPPIPNMAEIVPIAGGHPLARELVADDADGQREDRAAGALDRPAGDQDGQRAARRATSEPGAEDASEMSSQRSLPYMSPSRPSSGVAIDEVRRKAVNSQVASAGSARKSALDLGQRRDDHRLRQRVGRAPARGRRACAQACASSAVTADPPRRRPGARAGGRPRGARPGSARRRSRPGAPRRARAWPARARGPSSVRTDVDHPPVGRARHALDEARRARGRSSIRVAVGGADAGGERRARRPPGGSSARSSGSRRWYCERLSSPSSPRRPRMRRVARRKSSSAEEKASCSVDRAPAESLAP